MTEKDDGVEDVDRYFDIRREAKARNEEYVDYLFSLLGDKNRFEASSMGIKMTICRYDPESSMGRSKFVRVGFEDSHGEELYDVAPLGLEYCYLALDVAPRMVENFQLPVTSKRSFHHFDGFSMYLSGGSEAAAKFLDQVKAVVDRVKEIVEKGG